jgi:hypothetical protein
MSRTTHDQRSLFPPSFAWAELPEESRQHALDVLTALYLEAVRFETIPSLETDSQPNSEATTDDHSLDH